MKLIIIHHHFRAGGVRRVIESAVPSLVRVLRARLKEIVLAGGEAPAASWLQPWAARLDPVPVSCAIDPALGYIAEQPGARQDIARRIRRFLDQLLPEAQADEVVVWAHNQGLGRNLFLTRALATLSASRGFTLLLHHHDWWFDNRWQRWPELRRCGWRSLGAVADTVFPSARAVRMMAINQADTAVLERHFPKRVAWLPNPVEPTPRPPENAVRQARRWLEEQVGQAAPIWLMPCRLVRRKNIPEALLLTRWLRPEAWLVTTGGVSSADEAPVAQRLAQAAQQHGWRLRLAVLQGDESAKPTIPQLLAASEVLLLTSLQEGFGLPYVEAASAGRPLMARSLPNMAPDLAKFGFRFPQSYAELWIAPQLFDWAAERARQRRQFDGWRRQLPRACQRLVGQPQFLAKADAPQPVAFSRLTLAAQLEVLAWPPEESFARCAPLNPALELWRAQAASGALKPTPWPAAASKWLGGAAYGRRFANLLRMAPEGRPAPRASRAVQEDFLRLKLVSDNLYPVLWSTQA